MTDIRTVKREECGEFLQLLCDTFGLDFDRAEQVFYTEPMFDLQRKWALFEGPEIVSILTTVPVEFGWGRGIGIAGVATRLDRRGEGLAARLMERVLEKAAKDGEGAALLFAADSRLYERMGFEVADTVVRGRLGWAETGRLGTTLEYQAVKERYRQWAESDPARLRRDERRWAYWRWSLRVCIEIQGGYACMEGNTLREAVVEGPLEYQGLALGSEWVGLAGMAKRLGLELQDPADTLMLMARNVPEQPQMFVTDQF